ncbi:growth factor receptor-bound protein 10 isoform X2 [Strigops habroptila]|uniref:growth factor receptor-bound protein 10 isoform X2 n=1 Tax=Strigops habroptila TaxID=2489341 RepID=UPI0011CF0D42|nr:growth factor receptor-bound protein 10 isoform X2 [Strigops habroptila]
MALAGCPDSFLHLPYRIDNVDQTSAHGRRDLVEPGFQEPSNRISLNHQDDDVDLEALVNDMNSSFESLYSTCSMQSETTPLLHNGQLSRSQLPSSGSGVLQPMSPRQKVQRSQPVRIMAVRRLQEEEQQFRTSSLPAIPNPFPELCSPASSPVLAPGSLPQGQPASKHNFFPEQMVAWCQQTNGSIPQSQLLQNFLNSSSCPEIQGFLHVKELGRKSWKKLYVCLRRSGLYCSTKGTSKEPRHLQLLADLEDSNIFSLIAGKKLYNAPAEFGFCIKPNRVRNETKELRLLCAEDEQSRTCWMTAFRLLKYGMLLYQNYRIPQQRKAMLPHFSTPVRSVSENSLVAMDFSGQIGRVIENPAEAQSAALEEGHAWRKRSTRMNILGSQSPLHPSTLSTVIHRTQHWFHGRISREESHRIIKQQGLVDGLFLLRDSQSNPKAFVLTLCHHQKIKHFQILPCEDDGQIFFSLDDGNTKFSDLIQLVEFYQLNKGVLPCKLKHHCIRVAL